MDCKQVRSHFRKIAKEIQSALKLVENCDDKKVIELTLSEIHELIENGEEYVAYELICENLFEVSFPLSMELYQEIESLGRNWSDDESNWDFLLDIVVKPNDSQT